MRMKLSVFLIYFISALAKNCEKLILASSYLSVRPFVRVERIFIKIWYVSFFENIFEKNSSPIKILKEYGYMKWRLV